MKNVVLRCSKAVGAFLVALAAVLTVACIMPNSGAALGTSIKVEAAAKISKSNVSLPIGASEKIKVNGNSKKVTWKSTKTKVATVNSKGKITAKKAGTAKIQAKVGKKTYTCKVKVLNFKLNKTSVTVYQKKTTTLKVTGTKKKVTYKSANTKIATVSKKGVVKGVKKGSTTIKVTVGKDTYKVPVKVNGPVVITCPDTITVGFGQTKTVTLKAGDSFTYTNQNGNLIDASITPYWFKTGDKLTMKVSGLRVGTTYIVFKAKTTGWTKKCKVVVTGNKIGASAVAGTVSNIKVNSVAAYKSYNTTNPELYVTTSVTNNIDAKIDYIDLTYGIYDKSGKLIDTDYRSISNPAKGKTYSGGFLLSSSTKAYKNAASVKLIEVKGHMVKASIGAERTAPTVVVDTTKANISVSNLQSKHLYYYNYNEYYSYFGFYATNKTSQNKYIKVYIDCYDNNGKLISQGNSTPYFYFWMEPYEQNVAAVSSGDELKGALATGKISKIVLRCVEE